MSMSKKLIVAIDGPSGSGKSTSAKIIAQKLGYLYIDTGAMYRAITFLASSKLRETLGQVQQNEINNRLRLSADYLRTGKGTAAAMRDAVTTQALNNLR